jgi:hypothetical protein
MKRDATFHLELFLDALRRNGEARLRLHGGSMWPWLRGGDEVVVRSEPAAQIAPGAIVVCRREGRLFAHRVLRRARASDGGVSLVLKGDTLPAADPAAREEQIVGRVVRVLRGRREISLDTLPQAALARLCALFSFSSRFWTPAAEVLRRAARPLRRRFR